MSNFKYKWMSTDNLCIELEETKTDYVFRISKALVKHDPFDANFWRVERVSKNVLSLIGSKHFPHD